MFDENFEKWLKDLGFELGSNCMYQKLNDSYWVRLTPSSVSKVHEIQVAEFIDGKIKSKWYDNEKEFMNYFTDIMAVHMVMAS